MSTRMATRSTMRASLTMIDDSIAAPASGMATFVSGDVTYVHSPRGGVFAQSLAVKIPRDVIAPQIAGRSPPPESAASASIILFAIRLNVASGGTPKNDSIPSVSVFGFPTLRKISRNADDQIAALSYSLPA